MTEEYLETNIDLKEQHNQKNNNLDYMIDSTFKSISWFFFLSIRNSDNNPIRNYYFDFYMPLVEIKNFNVLFDIKLISNQTVSYKQQAYKKLVEMSKNYI